ncbi:N-acetylmuramoyl-L-alanine amidase [Hirschia maritima]|uniref:N-acetylmuramoyl-L-alanine amidase n=1 Tax=Hirschia maritima TaxID=1121961 RepID=UPI0003821967|nr:N-acetylmuramoyl-L-alanine amidase [Hirschia maritima]
MHRLFFALGFMFFGVFYGFAHADTGKFARITNVRFGENGAATRVVIDANTPIDYDYFILSNGARRIVLDMPRLRWSIDGLTSESGGGDGFGHVVQYRYGHNSPTTSRLVLDLESPADVVNAFRLKPKGDRKSHRIVLDLKSVSVKKFEAKANAEDKKRQKAVVNHKRRKPLIFIDAGHGGKDPGAIGVSKTQEKDIALAAALELRRALLATKRYDVAMTRDTDVFIELEDRVKIARSYDVDLFISLHADAGKKSVTRGASVYTLSASGEQRSDRLKNSNNWVLDIEKDDDRSEEVTAILVDLVKRETKSRSAEFAELLIPSITKQKWPTLRNTHRKAGFFVLLAPDVPAVLFEMGFMTNPSDEAILTSPRKRKKLIRGIVDAVNVFFADQEFYVAQR